MNICETHFRKALHYYVYPETVEDLENQILAKLFPGHKVLETSPKGCVISAEPHQTYHRVCHGVWTASRSNSGGHCLSLSNENQVGLYNDISVRIRKRREGDYRCSVWFSVNRTPLFHQVSRFLVQKDMTRHYTGNFSAEVTPEFTVVPDVYAYWMLAVHANRATSPDTFPFHEILPVEYYKRPRYRLRNLPFPYEAIFSAEAVRKNRFGAWEYLLKPHGEALIEACQRVQIPHMFTDQGLVLL